MFRELLENKYGKDGAKERIFCTTDKEKGTLKALADKEGYETFVVPDDVGGRFSVLTAVGLLPIAVSGADIDALMAGAAKAQSDFDNDDLSTNDCYKYAAIRNILYAKGYTTEILVSYEPAFTMMSEWYKQLFGESEGKDNKGIFPASVTFSTDLHSMGQYIQDGRRSLFETVVLFNEPKRTITIGTDPENVDGLNFLSGKTVDYVNKRLSREQCSLIMTVEYRMLYLLLREWTKLSSVILSTSLRRHALSADISSVLTRSTSPELRATRRICSLCSENLAMRSRRKLLRQDFN